MARTFTKRRTYKRRYSRRSKKVSTSRVVRIARSVLNSRAETKFLDAQVISDANLGNVSGPFAISLINHLLQGTTANATTRIGNNVFLRGVYLSLSIRAQASTTDNVAACRFVLAWNKGSVQNTANNGDIIGPVEYLANTSMLAAARNSTTLTKFRVLQDNIHEMVAGGMNGTATMLGPRFDKCMYIPVNKKVMYRTSTDPGSNTTYGGATMANIFLPSNLSNMLKDDLQMMIWATSNTCCVITVGIKLIWQDL